MIRAPHQIPFGRSHQGRRHGQGMWNVGVHYTTNCNTRSSDPEKGRNHPPNHFELIGIINKPLLSHVVGCLYYCISDARSNKHQIFLHVFFRTFAH